MFPPPSDLSRPLETRSISFENPTGARASGGLEASPLGVGRKGAPARMIGPGETVTLADIAGVGTIRHIWLTGPMAPKALRGVVIRAWWDDQDHPSIEAPVGDLFGFALVGRFDFAALMGIAALIWIFQGIFSVLWLKRYEMCPAEWLLRALTYGALKPLARAGTS